MIIRPTKRVILQALWLGLFCVTARLWANDPPQLAEHHRELDRLDAQIERIATARKRAQDLVGTLDVENRLQQIRSDIDRIRQDLAQQQGASRQALDQLNDSSQSLDKRRSALESALSTFESERAAAEQQTRQCVRQACGSTSDAFSQGNACLSQVNAARDQLDAPRKRVASALSRYQQTLSQTDAQRDQFERLSRAGARAQAETDMQDAKARHAALGDEIKHAFDAWRDWLRQAESFEIKEIEQIERISRQWSGKAARGIELKGARLKRAGADATAFLDPPADSLAVLDFSLDDTAFNAPPAPSADSDLLSRAGAASKTPIVLAGADQIQPCLARPQTPPPAPSPPTPPTPPPSVAQTDCSRFGPHAAAWDNGNGKPLCFCKSGYSWNADGTACVPGQTVAAAPPTPAPQTSIPQTRPPQSGNTPPARPPPKTPSADCPRLLNNLQQASQRAAVKSSSNTANTLNAIALVSATAAANLAHCDQSAIQTAVNSGRSGSGPYPGTAPNAPVRTASCNAAVKAGANRPETVQIDLGFNGGNATFSWQMFTVKDRMVITAGGHRKDTGCVSQIGRFDFFIPPGAGRATVQVFPDCERRGNTRWNFKFECPR